MTSRDFCYWLQGAIELGSLESMSYDTFEILRNHLNMVFIHEIDPSFPAEQQNALDRVHTPERRVPLDIESVWMKC
jgi:hypothetical protein